MAVIVGVSEKILRPRLNLYEQSKVVGGGRRNIYISRNGTITHGDVRAPIIFLTEMQGL